MHRETTIIPDSEITITKQKA